MMPPPVPQSGSRAGLITTLVIFVLLTFVGGGLYISTNMKVEDLERRAKADRDQLAKFVDPNTEFDTPEFRALFNKAQPAAGAKVSVYQLLKSERDDAIKLVTGNAADLQTAQQAKRDAIERARGRLDEVGQALDAAGLAEALTKSVEVIPGLTKAVKEAADKKVKETQDEAERKAEALARQIKEQEGLVEKLKGEANQLRTEKDSIAQSIKGQVDTLTAQQNVKLGELQDRIQQVDLELRARIAEVEGKKKELEGIKNILRSRRVAVAVSLVRNVDGFISNIASQDKVFISLGQGDGIPAGLTFEVYDKNEGIPRTPPGSADEDKLPAGKASIEVLRVGQNTSECAVVRKDPGTIVQVGDVIANIVYDKNVRFNFTVYAGAGFDLANSGRATLSGAEIIKSLIKRWGGSVLEVGANGKLSVETDILIMGKEPVVPTGDKNDPIVADAIRKATEALKAYEAVRDSALDTHIPIMNQNRFLYFIGYFDQAKKVVP